MIREFSESQTSGRFVMHSNNRSFSGKGLSCPSPEAINTFVYNKGDSQEVVIDEISYVMPARCILPLVSNQHFVFDRSESLTAWQFNRDFYCIIDHDADVGRSVEHTSELQSLMRITYDVFCLKKQKTKY